MMMPQGLADNAAVEVEFTDEDSNTETYSANIKGLVSWAQGKTVTYAISITPNTTKYILTVTPPDGDYAYTGDTKTVSITSYKEEGGVKTALGWNITELQCSYDDGDTWSTVSAQLVLSSLTGSGGSLPEDLTANIEQTDYEMSKPFDDALTNATPVTTRRDLSYYDVNGNNSGSRNTANCYVVRAPGLYRFPIVYGNAIKNGATNSNSYTSHIDIEQFDTDFRAYVRPLYQAKYPSYTEAQVDDWVNSVATSAKTHLQNTTLYHFLNAYNEAISDPWIHKNSHSGSAIVPTTAEVAWQDYDNIIRNENVSITQSGDEYYVDFEVKKEDIMLGNAVIQVKDGSGVVQWSWHIWMTSADLTTAGPFVNQNGCNFSFLPQPIGYVEKEVALTFLPRKFRIKAVQDESGKEAVFMLTQLGGSDTDIYYAAPYYQWGRKDPMPMEDIDAFTIDTRSDNKHSPFLYEAIQNPCMFYAHPGSGGSSDKNWHGGNADQMTAVDYPYVDNLWDAEATA